MIRVGSRLTIFYPVLNGMAVSPETKRMVDAAADRGAERARELAAGFANTGAYLDSLDSWHATLVDGRWQAAFGSTSSVWHLVEFGTATNPPYRVLTQAAESIGVGFSPE